MNSHSCNSSVEVFDGCSITFLERESPKHTHRNISLDCCIYIYSIYSLCILCTSTSIHPSIHQSIQPIQPIHPSIHQSIHPSIHAASQPASQPASQSCIHACKHTYIRTYIDRQTGRQTDGHTHMHLHIYIYTFLQYISSSYIDYCCGSARVLRVCEDEARTLQTCALDTEAPQRPARWGLGFRVLGFRV